MKCYIISSYGAVAAIRLAVESTVAGRAVINPIQIQI